MSLLDNAKFVANFMIAQKWGDIAAKNELKDAVFKIHSISMGTSKVFHFSAYLPSGRCHDFKIVDGGKVLHEVLDSWR
jgi:hypothetical protein